MKDRSSASVIARVQLIEAPYLSEFVRWCVAHLEFDRVYLVNTEPEHRDRILSAITPELREGLSMLECPLPKRQQNAIASYYPALLRDHLREDFVLNVDCDEFLFLPKSCRTIKDFLQRHPQHGAFRFHWLNVASASNFSPSMVRLLQSSERRAHDGRNVKMMARRERITGVDHHSFDGLARVADFRLDGSHREEAPFIAHFIARSRTHTLLKILHQDINNLKSRGSPLNRPDHLRALLLAPDKAALDQLPPRIILHMIELLQSERANILPPFTANGRPDGECKDEANSEALQEFFAENLSALGISGEQTGEILRRGLSQLFNTSRLRDIYSRLPYSTANPMLARLLPILSSAEARSTASTKHAEYRRAGERTSSPRQVEALLDYELIIHPGRPKTATTSLQRLLAENACTLAKECGIYIGQPFRDPKFGHWRVSFDPNWLVQRTERDPRAVAAGGGSFQGPLLRLEELNKMPNPSDEVRKAFQLDTIPPGSRLLISDESLRIAQIPVLLRFFRLSEILLVVREPSAWITSAVRQNLRSLERRRLLRADKNTCASELAGRIFRGESWNPEVYVARLAKTLRRSESVRTPNKHGRTVDGYLEKIRLYAYEQPAFGPARVLADLAGDKAPLLAAVHDVRLNVRDKSVDQPLVVSEDMRRQIKQKLRANTGLIRRCRATEQTFKAIELYSEAD